jgi:hypothetical protein
MYVWSALACPGIRSLEGPALSVDDGDEACDALHHHGGDTEMGGGAAAVPASAARSRQPSGARATNGGSHAHLELSSAGSAAVVKVAGSAAADEGGNPDGSGWVAAGGVLGRLKAAALHGATYDIHKVGAAH